MEEKKVTTQNGEGTQLEGENNANQSEKMFTQEDVNRIVQERLTRERSRAGQSFDDREKELARRESRMTCAERLADKGYSKELLDILDTSDADKFMKNVEKLEGMGLTSVRRKLPFVVGPTSPIVHHEDADLRKAFGLSDKENK